MSVKLLTEHHLEFLSLKGGCKGLSESTLVKMPHCWKSHVATHLTLLSCWIFYVLPSFQYLSVTCRYLLAESKTVDPDQLAFQKPASLDLHCFVCFNALIPSQHFFSHIRTNFCLPGLNSVQSSG